MRSQHAFHRIVRGLIETLVVILVLLLVIIAIEVCVLRMNGYVMRPVELVCEQPKPAKP